MIFSWGFSFQPASPFWVSKIWLDAIWLWLTWPWKIPVFNRYTQVNHLFLWAMASMAMLNNQRVSFFPCLLMFFLVSESLGRISLGTPLSNNKEHEQNLMVLSSLFLCIYIYAYIWLYIVEMLRKEITWCSQCHRFRTILSYFEPKSTQNYGYDKWGVPVVVFKPTGTNKSENSFPVAIQPQIPQGKKQLHGISHDIFIRNEWNQAIPGSNQGVANSIQDGAPQL